MKQKLKRTADLTLEFESLEPGDTLYLDGEKVKFAGENNGNVWITVKRETHFIRKSDERYARLRLEP